jgi:hypothetical protein
MIKPLPLTVSCSHCGWQKTITPKSDVLMPATIPTICPRCGYIHLTSVRANWLEQLKAKITQFVPSTD